MINSPYPTKRFDDVFEAIKRPIALEDATEYACLGVRWYGLGAYVRESKLGGSIARKQQWIIRANDVVYNKLFAWRGAFAVADQSVDGCIASDKFPTYSFDASLVFPEYLRLWFQSHYLSTEAESYSKGAAALSKLTLNPPDFWKLKVPLPSLDEQQAIAAKASRMLGIVNRVVERRQPLDAVIHGRRAGIGSQVRLILDFALDQLNDRFAGSLVELDSVLMMRPRSGPSFVVTEEGTGIPVIMPSATLGYRYDPNKALNGLGGERLQDADVLEAGDLLITRGNYRDQVGICIVYPGSSEKRTYANLIMRMKVDKTRVMPEFVKYWIMSPSSVRYIREHTKGTSPSVQKINQRSLIALPFPKHVELAEQRRWVERLDSLFQRVEELETAIRTQHDQLLGFKEILLKAAFEGGLLGGASHRSGEALSDVVRPIAKIA